MGKTEIDLLIQKYTQGAVSGFDALYDTYSGLVRAVVCKICGVEELDDRVQEVFIRIWKGLPRYRSEAGLKTWIYRIAVNVAIDALRRKKPESALNEELLMSSHVANPTGFHDDDRDLVHRGLAALDPDHRAVLVMQCFEGLSIEEIAEIMAIPAGTVKSRLHHAKLRLAAHLKSAGVVL